MRPLRRLITAAAAVPAVAVLAACTLPVGPGLDTARLEEEIARDLERQGDVQVGAVACPTDIRAQAGDVFVCRASGPAGTTFVIEVTQDDDDGAVSWRVTAELTDPPPSDAG